MIAEKLVPPPDNAETFEPKNARFVPVCAGCYALATFSGVVLYIGRTTNLRARMKQHLADDEKIDPTHYGRATLFSWIACDDIERIERTWTNTHIQWEGCLPVLNSVYPAVST